MRKLKYTRNMNCPVSDEMFLKIKEITDEREISFSEFIRDALSAKLMEEEKDD